MIGTRARSANGIYAELHRTQFDTAAPPRRDYRSWKDAEVHLVPHC